MNAAPGALDHWRETLAQVQLPVFGGAATSEALLQPGLSIQQLGRLLLAEPPLALDVILMAARLPRLQGEVQGLQHALGVLGVDRVQQLVRSRMNRLFNDQRPAHRAALQALSTSRLAAALVEHWDRANLGGRGESLQWAAMILGLARWKLPLAAPDLYLQIERRARAGEHRARVERELLGCRIDAVNRTLLGAAGLNADPLLGEAMTPDPRLLAEAARYAWTGSIAPALPAALSQRLRSRNMFPMLAHLLAWSACDGWYSRRTLSLMRAVSAVLHQPLDRIIADAHQVAVRVSRAPVLAGRVFTPAQQLFWPPVRRRTNAARKAAATSASQTFGETPRSQSAPAVPAPSHTQTGGPALAAAPRSCADSPTDTALVEAFVRDCRAGAFGDLRRFMPALVRTLTQGIGLARCVLMLKAASGDYLVGCFAHGFTPALEVRTLTASLCDDNLFARLYHRPGSALHLSAPHALAARSQWPPSMVRLSAAGDMFLASLHAAQRPFGVIWVDAGGAHPLSQEQYALFRQLARPLGAEFSRLAGAVAGARRA
ncbi:hypothetical protein B4966_06830 [Rhodocyclaceae bacterium]|nr:hypothetical protein B4966_06830 [Rhodocyclaceae bacterium]